MKKLIDSINSSDTFVRLLEVGAGVAIACEFFKYPNASKTIWSSESYYSREAFEEHFGKSEHRAVSAEHLKLINDTFSIKADFFERKYNTVLSTTFQTGGADKDISTHGWICLNIKNENIKYYHVSIHEKMSRSEYIKLIGEIGIKLLYCQNDSDIIPSNCYVDIVLDQDLKPLYSETL